MSATVDLAAFNDQKDLAAENEKDLAADRAAENEKGLAAFNDQNDNECTWPTYYIWHPECGWVAYPYEWMPHAFFPHYYIPDYPAQW